jgi:hypothetical protein
MSYPCSPCQAPLISCSPPPVIVNIGSPPTNVTYRLDITAFTGGLSNALDSLAISPFDAGSLVYIQIGGPTNPITIVQKIASTALPVDGAIIRPPDYNALTNAFQWYVVG